MRKLNSDIGFYSIIPEWLIDAGCTGNAIRLYALLGRYANTEGFAWPSKATLGKRLGCSVNSIDSWTRELVNLGALEVENVKRADGTNASNIYTVIYTNCRGIPPKNWGGTTKQDVCKQEEREQDTISISSLRSDIDICDEVEKVKKPTASQQRFDTVKAVLGGVHSAFGWPEPTTGDITAHLGTNRYLLKTVDAIGVDATVRRRIDHLRSYPQAGWLYTFQNKYAPAAKLSPVKGRYNPDGLYLCDILAGRGGDKYREIRVILSEEGKDWPDVLCAEALSRKE